MNFSFQLPMALKPATQFPLFAPPQPPHPLRPSTTEIRLSRWNNANAEKFIRHERTQKELEDQLRFQKRFDSALTIAHNYNPAPPYLTTSTKSTGTPSSPSSPSLPGKFSKYSKPPPENLHPAFKPLLKSRKINPNPQTPNFKIDENGVSYELPEAPFLYQYSYTETPKVKPIKLREPLVSPFGPETMAKPWLGRKPLPPSKKKLPDFDSFQLPPPHKKGVKPVQSPGPFLPGSGPKYVRSREEVLGEPLTKVEIEELVKGCQRSSRQLNMGRDGLIHNMLDNIHAHWKRRRVCKIKCKGVCTVDMDNVCQQLEERTGGKIIYNRGGVVYIFRGRNYNFKSRPRYPLMLWKPVSPVYPRLIKHAPEGLTLVEATEMRKKGRDLTPICKLAKNGVYGDLVKNIREAFEACELVRINCQGMNPSDYRKIGAKLKDLVPCVLLSFEHEHILIWRGRDWRSSILDIEESPKGSQEKVNSDDVVLGSIGESITESKSNNLDSDSDSSLTHENGESEETSDCTEIKGEDSVCKESEMSSESIECSETGSNFSTVIPEQLDLLNNENKVAELVKPSTPSSEAVLLLRKQAVENGMAFVLDNNNLDADIVFKQSVDFAKTAPMGPVFRHRRKELAVQKVEEQECENSEVKEAPAVSGTTNVAIVSAKKGERTTTRDKKLKDIKVDYLNVVPQGNLRVDELAKLLA